MVKTHTLDPTPDAPRSYNPPAIRLLIKDTVTLGLALNLEAAGEGDAEAMMMEGSSSLDSEFSSSVSSPFFPEVWSLTHINSIC